MCIVLIIIVGLHGIIHLFGFIKAFGFSEFNAISQPISKSLGILWLLAFIFFAVYIVLLSSQSNYGWVIGFMAVLLSQFLIITFWKDAKFGTVINLVILLVVLLAFSASHFQQKVHAETKKMLSEIASPKENIVTEQMIVNLPISVQNWLKQSGIIGKETIQSVYLEQDIQMLLKPEQKMWSHAKAKQYFTTGQPAFNWSVNLKMNSVVDIVGRDKFENGKGEMLIELFSLIPIVNAKYNSKIDQATLQRYLAEIVWFPTAALSPYITWEAIGINSVRATMTYNGTKGSGVFHFDKNGYFKKFVAMRYKDVEENSKPQQWTVLATQTELKNEIFVPVAFEVSWELEGQDWTWLKLKLTHIIYNVK